jgi:predicted nucleic acid-binding protein
LGLSDAIGPGPVALDTVAFIYFLEDNRIYAPVLDPLFREADDGRRHIVTSALTLLEVLVIPYRLGQLTLAGRYEALLTRSRGVRMVELGREQLRGAANLRALHRLHTPDAMQIAAALTHRAVAFVTNDRRLPDIPGLRIIQLADVA